MAKRNQNQNDEIDVMDFNVTSSGRKKKNTNQQQPVTKIRNREYAIVAYTFLALFLCLIGYFVYFLAVKSEDFINSPYNARLTNFSNTVIRGNIEASDGTILAKTDVDSNGKETRVYPLGREYAHAVGYDCNGMSGVELDGNFQLLRSNIFFLEKLGNELLDKKSQGDTIVTTLDTSLQKAAYDGLGSYDGAVIAIEPSTGKILAMVSKPDFDPNTVEDNWSTLTADNSESVLINRATQGLYPPGSTFKMITLLEYLQEHPTDYDQFSFQCKGSYSNGSYDIHCYNGKSHGSEDIYAAFGNSCNSAFADIGLQIDRDRMKKLTESLLFNKKLPTALSNTNKSSFSLDGKSHSSLVMQTAIGQGETLVTPMHMAMIASAIANDGVLMEPYIIDYTKNEEGTTIKTFKEEEYGSLLSADDAALMQEFMRYVVTNGTGSALNSDVYTAYGKTGTAEYNSNKDDNHSWFVGFAKDDNGKEIAIAVIMEGAGSGSKYAVPLAKNMMDTYFQ